MNDVAFVKCTGSTISFGPDIGDAAPGKRPSDDPAATEFALRALWRNRILDLGRAVEWGSGPATRATNTISRPMSLGTPPEQNTSPAADSDTTDHTMWTCSVHQGRCPGHTISLRFFSGRIFTTFRAGLALNMASSPVKGLIPLRALVAGFRTTTSFIRPGTV